MYAWRIFFFSFFTYQVSSRNVYFCERLMENDDLHKGSNKEKSEKKNRKIIPLADSASTPFADSPFFSEQAFDYVVMLQTMCARMSLRYFNVYTIDIGKRRQRKAFYFIRSIKMRSGVARVMFEGIFCCCLFVFTVVRRNHK